MRTELSAEPDRKLAVSQSTSRHQTAPPCELESRSREEPNVPKRSPLMAYLNFTNQVRH